MKQLFVFFSAITITYSTFAQAPSIEWQKCLGGTGTDEPYAVQQTSDSGYIVAGYSASIDGDVTGNHGGYDFWIVKLLTTGDIAWQKSIGGSSKDICRAIQETRSGDFVVVGSTTSSDGDLPYSYGSVDCYVLLLGPNGDIKKKKRLGGTGEDIPMSVQQTLDGGFIVAGSSGPDYIGSDINFWIVRLDSSLNFKWQKFIGNTNREFALSIKETADQGFIVAGYSYQNNLDAMVVKLSSAGNIEWQKYFGGKKYDWANCILQTSDQGYIFAGSSNSDDGDVGLHGTKADSWIIKMDALGNRIWQKLLGSYGDDGAYFIEQTIDGGYVFTGHTDFNDGDVTMNHGLIDYWVVKIDSDGDIEWQMSLGGSGDDFPAAVRQTFEGGYIVAGFTRSNDGNVSGNKGGADFWVAKLSSKISSVKETTDFSLAHIFPNPVQNILTVLLHKPEQNIIISNLMGQIMLNEKVTGGRKEIDVSHLPGGMYFVNNRKFVKE